VILRSETFRAGEQKYMLESLLTPQELATWLKMSRVWVYKQAEKGLLPFHRVGDAIRFDPEEIRAYLSSRKGLKRNDHLGR